MKQLINFWFTSAIVSYSLVELSSTIAQVIPDATLPVNSQVTPAGNSNVITGGTQAGDNLFHSFEQFSIPRGSQAYFNNALNIQNVISRVTGGSISNIDDLIQANGTANLFLLNPNGIIFGSNARLDIGGSFAATTVDALVWANGGQFSATNPDSPESLLSIVGDPSGFISALGQPAPILSLGSNLGVDEGQSLLLLGGDVTLNDSYLFINFFKGGRIELGGISEAGTVGLSVNDSELSLSFPNDVLRADVSLTNQTTIDVIAEGGGSIAINARNLNITDSYLIAGIGENLGSVGTQAGDITLNAVGTILINNNVNNNGLIANYIANYVEPGAIGNAGDINIKASSIETHAAQLITATSGQGNAGSIFLQADDSISLADITAMFSTVEPGGVGKGGNINIKAGSLSLTGGSQLQTLVIGANKNYPSVPAGRGDSGDVNIDVRDTVMLVGGGSPFTAIFTGVDFRGAVGNGGDININTGSLYLMDGAVIGGGSNGAGNAGNTVIRAIDKVYLANNSDFNSQTYRGNSRISSQTLGNGNGGIIDIQARSLSLINGAYIDASTEKNGNAGNITVTADTLEATNGGQIYAFAGKESSGNAGDINLNISDRITLSGSDPFYYQRLDKFSQTELGRESISHRLPQSGPNSGLYAESQGSGSAGDITINTRQLLVEDTARVTVGSRRGQAGNLTVNANSLSLNQGFLIAETGKSDAQGGANISLNNLELLQLANESSISANALEAANGGNISIDAQLVVGLPPSGAQGSDIVANAVRGNGGRVDIRTQGLFGIEYQTLATPANDITATSEFGISGIVDINLPNIDINRGLVNLPVVQLDTQVVQACQPGGSQKQSEFVVTGRGGLPPNPSDVLSNDAVWTDLGSINGVLEENLYSSKKATQVAESNIEQIVEATGWVVNDKGQVVLTASTPTALPSSSERSATKCNVS